MRTRRFAFLFLAFYVVFIGGSAYYTLAFPIRFFHHAVVTVLAASWYYRRWRRDGIPHTSLNKPIVAALVVWAISTATSIDRRMAVEGLWFVLLHVTIFFYLVDLFLRGRQKLVFETQFLLAGLVIFITGLELASWYLGLGFIPSSDVGWVDVIGPGAWLPLEAPRVALAMNISTLLAGYVAPLIPLTVAWAITARRKDFRQTLWVISALLVVTLLLTFSRGGLLSIGAAFVAWITMRFFSRSRGISVPRPGIVAAVALTASALFAVGFIVSQSRASGDRIRVDMYESAVEIFRDYPISGVGVGQYGRAFRDYRTPTLARDRLASAHNAYLNSLSEVGVIGGLVSIWLGVALVRAWHQNWRSHTDRAKRLRLEAAMAGFIGIGVHSLVDVFTTTPVVSVSLILAAYVITGHRTVLDERPKGRNSAAAFGLVVTLVYGVFFIQIDRAQLEYQRSLLHGQNGLSSAEKAVRLDPELNLYTLQVANIKGRQAFAMPSQDALDDAIDAYEDALAREPTWSMGWINLAALVERNGDPERALTLLENARSINPLTELPIQIGRLHEIIGEDQAAAISNYQIGIARSVSLHNRLPLSEFWRLTDARIEAVEQYAASADIDIQYRIWSEHDPSRLGELVSAAPQSAAEYWAIGEYALAVEQDPVKAEMHFSTAIERDRLNGDYYASRARATVDLDVDSAMRDLDIATLLGVRFEHPNLTRTLFATDADEFDTLLATALPARVVKQEFSAVLYGGRTSDFDTLPTMRQPGPGRMIMEPWYALASRYRAQGNIESARRVYEAIVEYAPEDTEARELLDEIG